MTDNDESGNYVALSSNGKIVAIADRKDAIKIYGLGDIISNLNCSEIDTKIIKNSADNLININSELDIRHGTTDNFILSTRTSDENGSGNNLGGFFGFKWDGTGVDYKIKVFMKDDDNENNYHSIGFFDNTSSGSNSFFTGQHRNISNNNIDKNKLGLIVISTNKIINIDGSIIPKINESLPYCELSVLNNDKKVIGVISDKEDINDYRNTGNGSFKTTSKKSFNNERRIFINSLGEGGIWVCNKNGSLENGDYISSTTVPGYGAKQTLNEGFLMNYTVAKITCDCNFSLTKIVKQQLKVITSTDSDETTTSIDYDTNGDIQFEDDLDENGNQQMVYPLETRFLQADGILLIDEADYTTRLANGESVYIACFVGCTYHCG